MTYLCNRNREIARVLSSVGSEHLVYTQRVGGSTPSPQDPPQKDVSKGTSFFLGRKEGRFAILCLPLLKTNRNIYTYGEASSIGFIRLYS